MSEKIGLRNETQTNLLNGLVSNCEEFEAWLRRWFQLHRILDEDKWWVRDQLAAAWDAGVRAALGLTPTPEEMRAHADAVDMSSQTRNDAKVYDLQAEVSALRDASQLDQGEIVRLRDLCLRAAGYIGVRQGPEVDEEADTLLKELRGET